MSNSIVCSIFLFALIIAQPVSAAITGTITDEIGDPIPRALVMFTSEPDSSHVVMAVTDSMGQYEIGELPLGIAEEAPAPFALGQNYPNPFNPATTIPLTLDVPGRVTLTVYNIMGQRIRTLVDGYLSDGVHAVVWDACEDSGQPVGSGVYFYRLQYGGHSEAKKMLLLDSGGVSGAAVSQPAARVTVVEASLYTVTVECFPYEKLVQEHVDVIATTIFDATLDDAGFMVSIPGGTFQMGDEVGDLSFECRPVHTVTVSGFEMDKYEITNEQFCAYLNAALISDDIEVREESQVYGGDVCGLTGDWAGERYLDVGSYLNDDNRCWISFDGTRFLVAPGYEQWPVISVTWYGANEFARYFGFDLATEAEWEYASRGGEHYMYGTSDGTISAENTNYDAHIGHPVDVGSYPANPFGVYDLSGNVMEWCHDRGWHYTSESQINPSGSETSRARAIRGGNWSGGEQYCRSAGRAFYDPSAENAVFGFRIVLRPGGLVY